MKYYIYLIILLASLGACTRTDKSDAYGNFEAVEVTISSQANGQILFLNIMEGDQIYSGDTIGLIDTLDLSLKKAQLVKNLSVMDARLHTIRSQMKVQEQQKKNFLVEKQRLDNLFKDGAATQKQMDDMNGILDLIYQEIEAT
jgi:HlyD family secretion protein